MTQQGLPPTLDQLALTQGAGSQGFHGGTQPSMYDEAVHVGKKQAKINLRSILSRHSKAKELLRLRRTKHFLYISVLPTPSLVAQSSAGPHRSHVGQTCSPQHLRLSARLRALMSFRMIPRFNMFNVKHIETH